MASTGIYTTLLQNAGMTDEQWAMEVALQADAQNVMASKVPVIPATQGSKIHVPKLSTFSAASVITRGASGDEGQSSSYTTISDSDAEITPVTAYSKIQIPVTVEAELLSGNRSSMWEQAIQTRMAQALGKKEEVTLLSEYANINVSNQIGAASGYHCMVFSGEAFRLGRWLSVRTREVFDMDTDSTKMGMYMDFGVKTVWDTYAVDWVIAAGGTPTWDDFLAAVTLLEAANAPKPYTAILHSSLYGNTYKTAEFWQANVQGEAGSAPGRSGTGLRPLGVEFVFSTNVVSA